MPDGAELRGRCEHRHETLQRYELELLIVHDWVEEEAARVGVAFTAREASRELHNEFPTGDLGRYLAFTGLHLVDEKFILEGEWLPLKLHSTILPAYARMRRHPPETLTMAGEIDNEVAEYVSAMIKRWTRKTRCRAGYVVALCKEYRG